MITYPGQPEGAFGAKLASAGRAADPRPLGIWEDHVDAPVRHQSLAFP